MIFRPSSLIGRVGPGPITYLGVAARNGPGALSLSGRSPVPGDFALLFSDDYFYGTGLIAPSPDAVGANALIYVNGGLITQAMITGGINISGMASNGRVFAVLYRGPAAAVIRSEGLATSAGFAKTEATRGVVSICEVNGGTAGNPGAPFNYRMSHADGMGFADIVNPALYPDFTSITWPHSGSQINSTMIELT